MTFPFVSGTGGSFHSDKLPDLLSEQFAEHGRSLGPSAEVDIQTKGPLSNNRQNDYNERLHRQHLYIAVSFGLLLIIAIPLLVILYVQNIELQRRNKILFDNQKARLREWEQDKGKNAVQTRRNPGYHRVLGNVEAEIIKDRIIAIMDTSEEIFSPNFSLDRLSELAGNKPRVISSVLNEILNKSFHELLNEYRVREACRRLDDEEHYGHLTIEAISASLGYKSRTTLLNAFKKQTGLTPAEYQRLSRRQSKEQLGGKE